uniref:Angiomotin-like n=1 Tax=Petromyzon marinus TaxID=7757 RepID=A0AAJ7U6Z5_PETMA|nr:angiomotin-like [Petromyzon marinus]XP_032830890.1 angiomotin-like [Petromyzon marinus]
MKPCPPMEASDAGSCSPFIQRLIQEQLRHGDPNEARLLLALQQQAAKAAAASPSSSASSPADRQDPQGQEEDGETEPLPPSYAEAKALAMSRQANAAAAVAAAAGGGGGACLLVEDYQRALPEAELCASSRVWLANGAPSSSLCEDAAAAANGNLRSLGEVASFTQEIAYAQPHQQQQHLQHLQQQQQQQQHHLQHLQQQQHLQQHIQQQHFQQQQQRLQQQRQQQQQQRGTAVAKGRQGGLSRAASQLCSRQAVGWSRMTHRACYSDPSSRERWEEQGDVARGDGAPREARCPPRAPADTAWLRGADPPSQFTPQQARPLPTPASMPTLHQNFQAPPAQIPPQQQQPSLGLAEVRAQRLGEALAQENRLLRAQLEEQKDKMCRLEKLESEICRLSSAYHTMVESSNKREALEKSMRRKMEAEIKRLSELNRQLMGGEALTSDRCAAEFEGRVRDLEEALGMAREKNSRLQEELQRKVACEHRVETLQAALAQLQAAAGKRDVMEQRLRSHLEKEVQRLKLQQRPAPGADPTAATPSSPSAAQGAGAPGPAEDDLPRLRRALEEQESRLLQLQAESTRWEQRYLEERALRQFTTEAAATAATHRDTSSILWEDRASPVSDNSADFNAAQRRCAEMENRLRGLHSQLLERDAVIRVLHSRAGVCSEATGPGTARDLDSNPRPTSSPSSPSSPSAAATAHSQAQLNGTGGHEEPGAPSGRDDGMMGVTIGREASRDSGILIGQEPEWAGYCLADLSMERFNRERQEHCTRSELAPSAPSASSPSSSSPSSSPSPSSSLCPKMLIGREPSRDSGILIGDGDVDESEGRSQGVAAAMTSSSSSSSSSSLSSLQSRYRSNAGTQTDKGVAQDRPQARASDTVEILI